MLYSLPWGDHLSKLAAVWIVLVMLCVANPAAGIPVRPDPGQTLAPTLEYLPGPAPTVTATPT